MDVTKVDFSEEASDPELCSLFSFTEGSSHDSFTNSVASNAIKIVSYEKGDVRCNNSIAFSDTSALCDNLRVITEIPEMCDVKFLVGKDKVPVYGVKAILATRSRTFETMIRAQENDTQKTSHRKFGIVSRLRKLTKRSCVSAVKSESKSAGHLTIEVDELDPNTFQRIVSYVHSGNARIDINNVIGLMNVADAYALGNLRTACYQYARRNVNTKTVFTLLKSTEDYTNYKWTRHILDVILTFVSKKSQQILQLPEFQTVSKETAILILSRPDMTATDETKFDAVLLWSRRQSPTEYTDHFRSLLDCCSPPINLHNIPVPKLQQQIQPLDIFPNDVIDAAVTHHCSLRLVIGQDGTPARSIKFSPSRRRSIRLIRGYFHRKLLLSPSYIDSSDSGFAHSTEDFSKLKTLAVL